MNKRIHRYHAQSIVLLCGVALLVLTLFWARVLLAHGALAFNLPRLSELLGKGDATVSMELGNYYFSNRGYNLKKAQHAFREAIALDDSTPQAHYQLGRTYFIVSEFGLAFQEMEKEEKLHPEFGKLHYMKGLIAGYAKVFDVAEEEFKKFIEYDSFNWAGYNDLAWIYFAQGKYKEAEATATKGLERAYGNPWLHNSIGTSQLAQGKKKDALEHFLQAKKGFEMLDGHAWGGSYPGNAPDDHSAGLDATRAAIERNISRARE